jgi:undecaprenyl-diphosphatase
MLDRASWLLVAVAFTVLLFAIYWVDVPISVWGQSTLQPARDFFLFVTEFGASDWILIPALALFLVSWLLSLIIKQHVPRLALLQMTGVWAFIFVAIALPGLLINVVKRLIGRARPMLLEQPDSPLFRYIFNDWTYQSFPSGHATTAFGLCFVLSFMAPRIFPGMLVFAVLVSVSRIIIGVHYPTDVLGGAVFGMFGAYAVRNFFAARGWVFRKQPDGRIVPRELSAVRRLIRGRR